MRTLCPARRRDSLCKRRESPAANTTVDAARRDACVDRWGMCDGRSSLGQPSNSSQWPIPPETGFMVSYCL
jgi:hypothetical protein